MGYKFQFVTLAGFHSLNHGMFELSQGYAKRGMAAYAELQQVRAALCSDCAFLASTELARWARARSSADIAPAVWEGRVCFGAALRDPGDCM